MCGRVCVCACVSVKERETTLINFNLSRLSPRQLSTTLKVRMCLEKEKNFSDSKRKKEKGENVLQRKKLHGTKVASKKTQIEIQLKNDG